MNIMSSAMPWPRFKVSKEEICAILGSRVGFRVEGTGSIASPSFSRRSLALALFRVSDSGLGFKV